MGKEARQVLMVADIEERMRCNSRVTQIEGVVNSIVGKNWFRYLDEPWQDTLSDAFGVLIIDKTEWLSDMEVEILRRKREKQPCLYVIFATNRSSDRGRDEELTQGYTRTGNGQRSLVDYVILGEFTDAHKIHLRQTLLSLAY